MISIFQLFPFRLRIVQDSIKSFALVFVASCAFADARQACPPLVVEISCDAQMSLRAGPNAPQDLQYIIAPQLQGMTAKTLGTGQNISFALPERTGQQISLAVVGLEPAGGGMTSCCMSVQRVHLPTNCPSSDPVPQISGPQISGPQISEVPDLAVTLTADPICGRQDTSARCSAEVSVTQKAGALDTAAVYVTLQGKDAQSLTQGDCSDMSDGTAVCALRPDKTVEIGVDFAANAGAATFQLCARLGVAKDDTARAFALQLALARAGYDVGRADGKIGPATFAALARFARDSGLPPITDEIPPEALGLLGLLDPADTNPANNLACAVMTVPKAPLLCDRKTTKGAACACLFKEMQQVSAQKCACPKGQILGPNGCIKQLRADNPPQISTVDTPKLRCNNPTVVLKDGACACRYKNTQMAEGGLCLCKSGLPPLSGLGCAVTFSIDIGTEKPTTDAP